MRSLSRLFILGLCLAAASQAEAADPQTPQTPQDILARAKAASGGAAWDAVRTIHSEVRVAKPYPNANCQQCHSGTLDSFKNTPEHRAIAEELAANRVSCASAGCHGVAHPFSKRKDEL